MAGRYAGAVAATPDIDNDASIKNRIPAKQTRPSCIL